MNQPSLTRDSHVILLLASPLGSLPGEDDSERLLEPSHWYDFASRIRESSLDSLGDLLQLDSAEWPADIWTAHISRGWAKQRLSQSTKLAMELEELNNRGIWVTTSEEDTYPECLLDALEQRATPFLYAAGEADHLHKRAVGMFGIDTVDEEETNTRRLIKSIADDGFTIITDDATAVTELMEKANSEILTPVVEVSAEPLQARLGQRNIREAVMNGHLTLVSPHQPKSAWATETAVRQREFIHGFAEYTIIGQADSADEMGVTDSQIDTEEWSSLFVCKQDKIPPANQSMSANRAISFDLTSLPPDRSFEAFVRELETTEVPSNHGDTAESPSDESTSATPSDSSAGHQSSLDKFE